MHFERRTERRTAAERRALNAKAAALVMRMEQRRALGVEKYRAVEAALAAERANPAP